MRHCLVLVTLTTLCLACQQNIEKDSSVTEPALFGQNKKTTDAYYSFRHTSLSDIALSSVALATDNQPVAEQAMQMRLLQRQLDQEYPIAIPQRNVEPLISPEKATRQYKEYMIKHAGEPILAVFKQLYPRILLNRYGILQSSNPVLVHYFTQHLVESHSQDFSTLASALTLLKPHLSGRELGQWLNVILPEAVAHEAETAQTIARLTASIAQRETKKASLDRKEAFFLDADKRFLTILKAETISSDLAQLRQLQQLTRLAWQHT